MDMLMHRVTINCSLKIKGDPEKMHTFTTVAWVKGSCTKKNGHVAKVYYFSGSPLLMPTFLSEI